MIFKIFFSYYVFEFQYVLDAYNTSQFGLAAFQVVDGHVCLVASTGQLYHLVLFFHLLFSS